MDRIKPDFIVHVPGQMDYNELVLEVKPINARKPGIAKDLQTLTAFRQKAGYKRAILLVYGGTKNDVDRFKKKGQSIAEQNRDGSIDRQLIELWHHSTCGKMAESVGW
ncbi:MAG: hypothetical protein IT393_10375 [Nitrospirae bacterium]|nr:hypothetical protein [Nitrospirota bacterium]